MLLDYHNSVNSQLSAKFSSGDDIVFISFYELMLGLCD